MTQASTPGPVSVLAFHCESTRLVPLLRKEAERLGRGIPTDRPGLHKDIWTAAEIIEQAETAFSFSQKMDALNPAGEASGQTAEGRDRSFIPGMMRCAKCDFVLVRTNLYVRAGTTGPGDNKTEPCPNGCGPLWPMTWQQHARDMAERCEAAVLEAANLRKTLETGSQALDVANQHIQHMAAWISKTNASDTPLHGYSFEALGEDKWIIDQAVAALKAERK